MAENGPKPGGSSSSQGWENVTQHREFLPTCVDGLGALLEEQRRVCVPSARPEVKSQARDTMVAITKNLSHLQQALKRSGQGDVWQAVQSIEGNGAHVDAVSGFFIVLSELVDCVYVSPNVKRLTGIAQAELMGQPMLNFVHDEDKAKVKHFLSRQKNHLPSPVHSSTDSGPSTSATSLAPPGKRQFFHFKFLIKGTFDHVNMMGHYKQIGEDTFIFLGIVRPVEDRPITELSVLEATQDQYITRHLPEGKIIFADQRITTLCGYVPSEIVGKSGFNYIFGEDLPWTTMAQRQMFANMSGEGFTTYRLLCKDGTYNTVQTRGYIEFNKHTQKVESFMAINTVIEFEEGKKYLEQQKDRFTPYITLYQQEVINDKQSSDKLKLLFASLTKEPTDTRKRRLGDAKATTPSTTGRAPKYRVMEGHRVIDITETANHKNGDTTLSHMGTTS
eukprot:maker-scaffold96_size378025-snap-gene-2.44 protein:Tk04982 transcript:maker-scaffold96_size378025-snap-gene-2.44-mRNA-1 annotation:"methoprene-tolerant protein"